MNKLWFIITYLLLQLRKTTTRLKQVENDTNEFIAVIEKQANDKLQELAQKQMELDQIVLNTWEDNARELWIECQQLRVENQQLKDRLDKELRY